MFPLLLVLASTFATAPNNPDLTLLTINLEGATRPFYIKDDARVVEQARVWAQSINAQLGPGGAVVNLVHALDHASKVRTQPISIARVLLHRLQGARCTRSV